MLVARDVNTAAAGKPGGGVQAVQAGAPFPCAPLCFRRSSVCGAQAHAHAGKTAAHLHPGSGAAAQVQHVVPRLYELVLLLYLLQLVRGARQVALPLGLLEVVVLKRLLRPGAQPAVRCAVVWRGVVKRVVRVWAAAQAAVVARGRWRQTPDGSACGMREATMRQRSKTLQ